jgi:hypothetical protein
MKLSMLLIWMAIPQLALAGWPVVDGVILVNSSTKHGAYSVPDRGEQMRTVPLGGVDIIQICFSQNVPVSQANIRVRTFGDDGTAGPFLPISHTAYSAQNGRLVVYLEDVVFAARMQVSVVNAPPFQNPFWLSGHWLNPKSIYGTGDTWPSGDGFDTPKPFQFRFNVLSADFDRDNDVDGDDFLIMQGNTGETEGMRHHHGDANADGAVDGDDWLLWQQQFGTSYLIWPQ